MVKWLNLIVSRLCRQCSEKPKGSQRKIPVDVKKNSWESLKRKLKLITKKTKPYCFGERLKKLAEIWRGWVSNYRFANIDAKLKSLDEWLRNRLRNCIWHDWKKPERKRKNLIRLGVDQDHAHAWSRTRKGGWAVVQSAILGTTITPVHIEAKYEPMLEYYQKFQTEIQ
jgi:RNA-directed DNA polymerase